MPTESTLFRPIWKPPTAEANSPRALLPGDIIEGWWQGVCVWLILLVGSVCTVHGDCVYYYPRLNSSSPAGVRISWRLVQCTANISACILYVLHLNPQPAPSQRPRSSQNIPLVLLLSFAHKFNCLESLTDGAEYLCSSKIIWVCC